MGVITSVLLAGRYFSLNTIGSQSPLRGEEKEEILYRLQDKTSELTRNK